MALIILSYIICLTAVKHGVTGINVNDILNVNYLPGTFLLDNVITDVNSDANITANHNTSAGNWKDAFYTMDFHRKMMNEYLCRNYVAEEILSDMGVTSAPNANSRVGSPAEAPKDSSGTEAAVGHNSRPRKIDLSAIKESLLADQGSSYYKNWLARTTTLEDIYRHYEDLAAEDDASHDETKTASPEYDGEVTGYAVEQTPMSGKGPVKNGHNGGGGGGYGYGIPGSSAPSGGGGYNYGGAGSSAHGGGGGYNYGGSDHGHSSSGYSSFGGPHTGYGYHSSLKSDKAMALKDLFDLALTALAFKCFGLFVLNVIMCIYGGGGAVTTPMATEDVGRQRSQRAASYQPSSAETLNAMSMRVLRSIEVFFTMQNDDGKCLRHTLCDNNRFSRRLEGTDRIWLPVWSFGLSWVAGRFSPNQHASVAILDYLRASILGLGNSECVTVYPRCSLQEVVKSRDNRRKRRRRIRHGETGHQ